MNIVTCDCGQKFKVPPDEYAGETIQCPQCKKSLRIALSFHQLFTEDHSETEQEEGEKTRKQSRKRIRNTSSFKGKELGINRDIDASQSQSPPESTGWGTAVLSVSMFLLICVGFVSSVLYLTMGETGSEAHVKNVKYKKLERKNRQLQQRISFLQEKLQKQQKQLESARTDLENVRQQKNTLQKKLRTARKKKQEIEQKLRVEEQVRNKLEDYLDTTQEEEASDDETEKEQSQKPEEESEEGLPKSDDQSKTAQLSVSEVVKRSMPSVVQIRTDQGGLGSGFFLKKNGLLVTNYHVIKGAERINVKVNFQEGAQDRTYQARAVAADMARDIALLKADIDTSVPHLNLVDDGAYQSGEKVVAIGNPALGKEALQNTVTTGILSNVSRMLDEKRFLQTSTAVNPGNSGGPLLNLSQKVVGVVTLKGKGQNLNFAVPSSAVRELYKKRDQEGFRIDPDTSVEDWKKKKMSWPEVQNDRSITLDGKIHRIVHWKDDIFLGVNIEDGTIYYISTDRQRVKRTEHVDLDIYDVSRGNQNNANKLWVVTDLGIYTYDIKWGDLYEEKIGLSSSPDDIVFMNDSIVFLQNNESLHKTVVKYSKRKKRKKRFRFDFYADELYSPPGESELWVSKFEIQDEKSVSCSVTYFHLDKVKEEEYLHKPDPVGYYKELYSFDSEQMQNCIDYRIREGDVIHGLYNFSRSREYPKKRHSLVENEQIQKGFIERLNLHHIRKMDPKQKWLVSGTHLYDADSGEIVKELPVPTTVMGFTRDSSALWIYDAQHRNLIPVQLEE